MLKNALRAAAMLRGRMPPPAVEGEPMMRPAIPRQTIPMPQQGMPMPQQGMPMPQQGMPMRGGRAGKNRQMPPPNVGMPTADMPPPNMGA